VLTALKNFQWKRLLFTTQGFEEPRKLALIVVLCLAWSLTGLIGHHPWKPDEAYSFGLIHHMLNTHQWVIPNLAGEPFVEKPPLYYFTAAILAKYFSSWLSVHDAARLASGFYMALTLLFVGMTGRELWGSSFGRITVLILIGCLGLIFHAHEMITETALQAGLAITFYGLALSARRSVSAGLFIGTGIGIAFMSKGLLEPMLMVAIALLLPLLFQPWRTWNYGLGLLLALVSTLPWIGIWPYALSTHSPTLFHAWWWDNNLEPALSLSNLRNEPFYFLSLLPWFAWPAFPLALWMLWYGNRVKWWDRPAIQLGTLSLIVILAGLSLFSDTRDVNALPVLLPLSLLAAGGINRLQRGAASALDWFGLMTFGLISTFLWTVWAAMAQSGHPPALAALYTGLPVDFAFSFQLFPFLVAFVYTLIWLTVISRSRRSNTRALTNWAIGLTLSWGLFTTLWLPWLDSGKNYRVFSTLPAALPQTYHCIAGMHLGKTQRAMLEYYARIVTVRTESASDTPCDVLFVQSTVKEPVAPGSEWESIWAGSRPGDDVERYSLYRKIK
jgi:4-amino-4-deoxy-L-arabinose transferase-like glycosyltransferase